MECCYIRLEYYYVAKRRDISYSISTAGITVFFTILFNVGAVVVYPLNQTIASVFASNQDIIRETESFLRVVLPLLPFFGVCVNATSVGRGSGHTAVPTLIEIVRIWTVRIALGYLLAFTLGMGPIDIWMPFSLSNAVGGIALAIWVKYGKWERAVIKTTQA